VPHGAKTYRLSGNRRLIHVPSEESSFVSRYGLASSPLMLTAESIKLYGDKERATRS
jgi:hypothetical protein